MWSEPGPASPGRRASGRQLGHRRSPPSPVLLPGFKETEIKSQTTHRKALTRAEQQLLRCGLNNTKAAPLGCETMFFKKWP